MCQNLFLHIQRFLRNIENQILLFFFNLGCNLLGDPPIKKLYIKNLLKIYQENYLEIFCIYFCNILYENSK